MFDMHTHILPGIDDGSSDWATTDKMVAMAYQSGTRSIILTPHHRNGYTCSLQTIQRLFEQIKHTYADRYPDLKIYLGTEIYYQSDMMQKLLGGKILTMSGSRYILLEFGTTVSFSVILRAVNEAANSGFRTILAHIERYECLRRDWKYLDELVDFGALLQINADSVMGRHGFGTKMFCRKLLKQNMVSFVASDAHDAEHRTPVLQEAEKFIRKKYGTEYAEELFYSNSICVIQNRII
ncbi:MAG: capsular biosynthesis protein [Clostridia bacterium]|nr:capsular biosynthesis protein [Clostridia bacterium]